MAVHLFGAIDVGSYEMELIIYEISKKRGIREIDDIIHRIPLGTDTYNTGKISVKHTSELRRVLLEFRRIMDNYGVEDYRAYGTSAIREMQNSALVLNRLEMETGIHIEPLGNAEQRFLDFKSIASRSSQFDKLIEEPTAIVDIGSGSIQISLFDNGKMVTTQNMNLGILRLHEQVGRIRASAARFEGLVEELVLSRLMVFKHLYLEERRIRSLILVDDYISEAAQKVNVREFFRGAGNTEEAIPAGDGFLSRESYEAFYDRIKTISYSQVARGLEIPEENVPLLFISGIILRQILRITGADLLWFPGVCLCDGIVYDYAEKKKYFVSSHDFEKDIISSAHEISRRYNGSQERSKTLEKIALKIFDSTSRIHGMGSRERLLLQIAAILHDCGKFISMNDLSECAYHIIMATEIIGLSGGEREIVANVVRFNHSRFVYYEEQTAIDRERYSVIARLTAILRAANGLDRSHKHKFSDFKIRMKGDQLTITVDVRKDITLEKGLFDKKADFFEEIFNIRPVIKQKKL